MRVMSVAYGTAIAKCLCHRRGWCLKGYFTEKMAFHWSIHCALLAL